MAGNRPPGRGQGPEARGGAGRPADSAPGAEPAEVDPATIDPATIDTGAPLAELADLGLTPTASFMARLRGRIGRRVLTADVVDFATTSPFTLFLEFLAMFFSGLAPARSATPASPARPTDPPRGDGRNGGSN